MPDIPDDFPDPCLADDVMDFLRRLDEEFRAEFLNAPEIPEN